MGINNPTEPLLKRIHKRVSVLVFLLLNRKCVFFLVIEHKLSLEFLSNINITVLRSIAVM